MEEIRLGELLAASQGERSAAPQLVLAVALSYANRGWPVLPLHTWNGTGCSCARSDCQSPAKHPRTRSGLKDATTDLERLRSWWGRWPDANIGLRTGVAFDVLDIDGQAGLDVIAATEREYGQVPPGPTSFTGGGGLHRLFLPTGIGNRAGILEHVDWRGVNGYIVAPPSLHASGQRYEWADTPHADSAELVAVNGWLHSLLFPPQRRRETAETNSPRGAGNYAKRAFDSEIGELIRAGEGTRNHTLNAAAYNLYQLVAGGELSEGDVTDALSAAATGIGLTPSEIEATLRSARTAGLASPRTAPALSVVQGNNARTIETQPLPRSEAVDDMALLRRWSMAELLAEPDTFSWLVRGLWADASYGMWAGEMKVLKSHLLGFLQVGVAAGVEIFGHFKPDQPRPVVAYIGEGGRLLYRRRLRRVAEAMGLNLADLPIFTTFDVAPILSEAFQTSLRRDLDELHPGLVAIDPYYAYHGTVTKAADLHQEGTLLNSLSGPCVVAGAALIVVNHYNQTGAGSSLKRITMAGGGEWSDSWVLIAHREDPDVAAGEFKLTLDIGSRQWGGSSWEIDLSIGRFDEDLGTHDGDITWDLRRANGTHTAKPATDSPKAQAARHAILEVLADKPWQLTKTEVYERIGGTKSTFSMAMASLADDGLIRHDQLARSEAGITKKRPLWGLNPNPDHSQSSGFNPGDDEDAF